LFIGEVKRVIKLEKNTIKQHSNNKQVNAHNRPKQLKQKKICRLLGDSAMKQGARFIP